jgi:hypothetical protein
MQNFKSKHLQKSIDLELNFLNFSRRISAEKGVWGFPQQAISEMEK